MADLYLGVDAGGTKTHALVCDRDGRVLGFGAGGGANWESVGVDGMLAVLGTAIDAGLAGAGATRDDLAAGGFGLAGLDWERDVELLDQAIATLALGGVRHLENDSFVALRAGCRAPFGIVSNAGTGTVSAGINRAGASFRTMAIGWGERGGAGELVEDAAHAIAAAHHGYGRPTALTEGFLAASGSRSVVELFERITRDHLVLGAEHAPLVLAAARAGDAVAIDLVVAAGTSLGRSVAGVASRLGMVDEAFELVTTGGLHRAGEPLLDGAFRATVRSACAGARIVPLAAPPAVGAVLLALGTAEPPGAHYRPVAVAIVAAGG
jgi:N-acetylglucosamine kinase-like BadF-type ATPase